MLAYYGDLINVPETVASARIINTLDNSSHPAGYDQALRKTMMSDFDGLSEYEKARRLVYGPQLATCKAVRMD
jgi:hypothetical protein